ncbi:MAG: hypothetical protein KC643_26350 [Nitrospira sp.]|nr:hypothetical protein [Nitrospira sp.]
MIPYFFPPEGSAGVYRPLRFVRQLVSMGWETTVVTGHPSHYERYDPQLVAQIPKETEILRVRAYDSWQAVQAWRGRRLHHKLSDATLEMVDRVYARQKSPLRTWMRSFMHDIESFYYFPDRARPWICQAVNVSRKSCLRKHPIAIWATIGPVSAGVVAQQTSLLTGIPYILDFRDPWELYYYESESQRPQSVIRRAHRTMYRLLEGAQAIVFLFPRVAECYYRAYKGALDSAKIHIIPNGYEGEIEEFNVPSTNTCNILYTGTLSTYRFDTFLQALQSLKIDQPSLCRDLRIQFVGDGITSLAREVNNRGISNMVQTSHSISNEELKSLNRNAHAFLILGRHAERKGHELVAGAKLFGYFKSRKPILGILPNDETKAILSSVGVKTVADVNSIPEIISVLQMVHSAWSMGQLASLLPEVSACQRYASLPQTLALICALEGKDPVQPFMPGEFDVPSSLRKTIEDKSLWYGEHG